MGKLTYILLGMAISSSAYSQSAANFNTGRQAPPKARVKTSAVPKKPSLDVNSITATPSRFVGPEEFENYVNTLSASFSMQSRETDPFGQPQDPNVKPVLKMADTKSAARIAQAQATPFPDIVRLIKITTVMPAEKSFLIDTRLIKTGQKVPLSFRNKEIQIEVTNVTSREIVFKNLATGEIASRQLDILPVGMTPGQNGISAPGMLPDRPNAPIELEVADPTAENSQNR